MPTKRKPAPLKASYPPIAPVQELPAPEAAWIFAAQNSNQLLCFLDMDGRVIFANNLMLRHLDRPIERAAGRTLESLVGADIHREVFAAALGRARAGFKQIDRHWARIGEGPARFFEISYYPFRDLAGEVQAVFIAMQNATDQKLLEQKLDEQENLFFDLANSSRDWIVRTDPHAAVTYLNPAAQAALEKGANLLLAVHPSDLLEARGAWAALLEHGRVTAQRSRIRDRAQRLRFIEWEGSLVLGRNREVEGCFLVLHDMTQSRRVELLAAEADLTPREIEIVRQVVPGFTNLNIARRLGISEQTVKVHLNSIFRKARVQNRTELAMKFASGEEE